MPSSPLRILQVLTYLSADGAYGGPTAVARMQTEELARRGHQVHLVTAWDGRARTDFSGVTVHAHRALQAPGLGFAGLTSPGAWRAVRRLAAGADVVHFHFARDLVQLPAERLAGRAPTVLQVHGMIRPDHRSAARALDAAFVRPAYRRAAAHLCLTEQEVADLPRMGDAPGSVVRIRNGVALPEARAAWSNRPTVVYVARLHERKRPVAFVEMAAALLRTGVDADFVLYGPDEGEAASVRAAIADRGVGDRVRYAGAVAPEQVGDILAAAQAYVLPSVDEPFPMALLEAMAHGLPAVITDRTGLSDELRARGSARVTDGSPASMADALAPLLRDEGAWATASERARADISQSFSASAVVDELERTYRRVARAS